MARFILSFLVRPVHNNLLYFNVVSSLWWTINNNQVGFSGLVLRLSFDLLELVARIVLELLSIQLISVSISFTFNKAFTNNLCLVYQGRIYGLLSNVIYFRAFIGHIYQ